MQKKACIYSLMRVYYEPGIEEFEFRALLGSYETGR